MSFEEKQDEIDALYKEGKYQQVFDEFTKLYETEPDNLNVVWRFARAHFDLGEAEKDATKKNEYLTKGLELINKALELKGGEEEAAVHKWRAILISETSKLAGTTERIKQAFVIRDEAKKALELDPTDPTPPFILGLWCYNVAGIGWMTRKLAATFFAEPPTATYQDSIDYHLKSHALEPNFKRNLYGLTLAYEAIGDKAKAKEFGQLTAAVKSISARDEEIDQAVAKYT